MAQDRKTIDDITRTLATLVGTERLPGRDGSGDFKVLLSTVLTYIQNNITVGAVSVPVGGIIPFYQNPADSLTIPSQFANCNGTRVSDGDSTWDGYRSPNINGDDVVLSATWTADGGGAYATIPAVDVTALFKGDSVSGSGIAAGSTITDITGNTVTISDISASGAISTTFTNPGRFLRGDASSGTGDSDRMQRITGSYNSTSLAGPIKGPSGAGSASGVFSQGDGTGRTNYLTAGTGQSYDLDFDNADSVSPNTAKTSDTETAPIYTTAIYIMRIK